MLRLQSFNNCRDSTWSSSGDGGRAPPPNSHCKWSSLFLFHSFEKAALPLLLLLQCLQSRRSILITGMLDFYLKWQRRTLLGLLDVILRVYKKGASREARLLQCSAAFVLEPSRRLCLSLFHKHRQTQVYLLDAVSRGSERSLCSFNPFIRSFSFCSHSVWLCDGIQMISASLCSVVRLTRAFQTVSSCDRQQTGSSSSLPVSLDVSLCLFFTFMERNKCGLKTWITGHRNRLLWDEESFVKRIIILVLFYCSESLRMQIQRIFCFEKHHSTQLSMVMLCVLRTYVCVLDIPWLPTTPLSARRIITCVGLVTVTRS